jgi:hypothetical protein
MLSRVEAFIEFFRSILTKVGERGANFLQRLSGKQTVGSDQDCSKNGDNESLQRVIHTSLACQLTVGKAMSEGLNESNQNFRCPIYCL